MSDFAVTNSPIDPSQSASFDKLAKGVSTEPELQPEKPSKVLRTERALVMGGREEKAILDGFTALRRS